MTAWNIWRTTLTLLLSLDFFYIIIIIIIIMVEYFIIIIMAEYFKGLFAGSSYVLPCTQFREDQRAE